MHLDITSQNAPFSITFIAETSKWIPCGVSYSYPLFLTLPLSFPLSHSSTVKKLYLQNLSPLDTFTKIEALIILHSHFFWHLSIIYSLHFKELLIFKIAHSSSRCFDHKNLLLNFQIKK